MRAAKSPAYRVLDWYDRSRRTLPWRAAPGGRTPPYVIWLSEIMLQQTTVAAVAPYFRRFLSRWPDVGALAVAPLDEVLKEWAGLGYYARARNLHACAKVVARDHGGRFPACEAELLKLPGIGRYTAAAIAAIAFDEQTVPVDGNVERVMARFHGIGTPPAAAKPEIRARAAALLPSPRPGDLAQALMDLGATVCTPKRPDCPLCPLQADCAGLAHGEAESLPVRAARAVRPVRRAAAFWAERPDGTVLVRRRPAKGLLGGMSEIPSSDWMESDPPAGPDAAPVDGRWQRLPGRVTHVFTHFALEMDVWRACVGANAQVRPEADPDRCRWVDRAALDGEALPSVMKKIAAHALTAREA